jgi:hypothetical protein
MHPQNEEARVLVLIAEDHLDNIPSVVETLKQKGLRVTNVLEDVGGIVTGVVPRGQVDALRRVKGVEDVLPDEEKTLAGPGASDV